ncbi:MAG: fibronectin type III domain-containing protein [Bacteroidetes bacterium]|nr:fibronectin type III domain-containing protein [Bacteroidota bacterium]
MGHPPLNKGVIFFEGNMIIENAVLRLEVNKGRKKTISNLQPKEEYWFYFYAGNSAGVSALSAPESRICL